MLTPFHLLFKTADEAQDIVAKRAKPLNLKCFGGVARSAAAQVIHITNQIMIFLSSVLTLCVVRPAASGPGFIYPQ